MLRSLFLSSISSLALMSGAFAADLPSMKGPVPYMPPPPPAFTWTGFYAGVNAGYVATLDNGNPYCVNPGGVLNGPGCSFQADTPLHSRPGGFIGGGQIGYNYQFDNFVAGVETDIQGTTASGTSTLTLINPISGTPHQDQVSSKLSYLGTIRGRLGIAVTNTLLIYGTGGLAYGGGTVSSVFSAPSLAAPTVLYPSAAAYDRVGWAAGGGIEYAFLPQWTLKLEGLYYDLGTVRTAGVDVTPPPTGYTEGKSFRLNGAIGRVGINYKFDFMAPPTPVVAKY